MSIKLTKEQRQIIDDLKKNMKDGDTIILLKSEHQKFKLMKIGKKIYEVTCNYGELDFHNCIIDMYLARPETK